MLTSFFRNPPRVPLRSMSQSALLAGLFLAAGSTAAHVGLPTYEGPLPHGQQTTLEDYAVTRQISTQAELSCNSQRLRARPSLNFAPSPDFRPTNNVPAQLPLVIRGNQAVLYAGKTRHTTSAQLHDGRLVFTSADDNFFNSLQGIQPGDQLLIHTTQTLRQYRISSVHLSHTIASEVGGEESLSLVACYPFQPVTSQPVFYELRARPLVGEHLDGAADEGRLINF